MGDQIGAIEPGAFEPNAVYRTSDIVALTGWSKWTLYRLKVNGVLVPRQAVKGGTCYFLGADIIAAFASGVAR